ncbi:DUF1127 domain-containing protein [Pseudogemmobacter sp. W21_MBD1_M6]|uniref:DUF1127 domain-containing protein n=1 Tax=Pseudogemmobacter sp. W21_MBD1_M6 TaxID=3240271 RepID=UPI003F997E75
MTTLALKSIHFPQGLAQVAAAPFRAFFGLMVQIAESNTRMRQVEFLNGLSDAQLAKRGLTRDGIVRHVFGDMFYL